MLRPRTCSSAKTRWRQKPDRLPAEGEARAVPRSTRPSRAISAAPPNQHTASKPAGHNAVGNNTGLASAGTSDVPTTQPIAQRASARLPDRAPSRRPTSCSTSSAASNAPSNPPQGNGNCTPSSAPSAVATSRQAIPCVRGPCMPDPLEPPALDRRLDFVYPLQRYRKVPNSIRSALPEFEGPRLGKWTKARG